MSASVRHFRNITSFVEVSHKFVQAVLPIPNKMSATVESNTSSWRKRFRDLEDDPACMKRTRFYYYRLESESSRASAEEDTESVCSLQDRETDVVRDTTDTDSKSDTSADEYEVEIEYEVASLTGDDQCENDFSNSSSGSDDIVLAAVAGAICEQSLEAWITDCEESDSSIDDTSFGRTDFTRCVQCKSENDNPLYRYCEKCFQDRKRFFPPRPRRYRRTKKSPSSPINPVKLDTLRSCLSGLSQDSGIGSSQECPQLDLDQIVVPIHLQAGTSQIIDEKNTAVDKQKRTANNSSSDLSIRTSKSSVDGGIATVASSGSLIGQLSSSSSFSNFDLKSTMVVSSSRKRQYSESSISDYEVKKPRREIKKSLLSRSKRDKENGRMSDFGSEISVSSFSSTNTDKTSTENEDVFKHRPDTSELCIFCNNAPKDSIFLHTNIAHRCCCYKCAKRTLHAIKRCPICNRSVNKVVKIYTS